MLTGIRAFLRFQRAIFILAREGLFKGLELPGTPPPGARLGIKLLNLLARGKASRLSRGQKLASAMTRLGPSYIKFGQFLATRPDVVGQSLASDLSLLQDRLPPFSMSEAKELIKQELSGELDDIFVDFSEPIAAASISQVHKAQWRDQEGSVHDLAIKLLRPGVEKRFQKDLESFYVAARLAERFLPDMDRLKPVSVVDILARSTRLEMDFRIEAAAISEFADNIKDDENFAVPEINWDLTGKTLLATSWIDGLSLNDQEAIEQAQFDKKELAKNLIQSFLRHAVRDGFFHADMHPGNIIFKPDGKIYAIDFGIMGRLSFKERQFLAEILYGFVTRNYTRIAEVHFEAGYVPDHHNVADFAQALRAIGEPIHGRIAEDVSMAKLLGLLFEVTELFDMATRPELILLQKTMVVVEGVGRMLDPELNMWEIAGPVMRQWIEEQFGPVGQLRRLGDTAKDAGEAAIVIPAIIRRAERLSQSFSQMAETGIKLDPDTAREIGREEARQNRPIKVALWVIAIALLLIALQLWMSHLN